MGLFSWLGGGGWDDDAGQKSEDYFDKAIEGYEDLKLPSIQSLTPEQVELLKYRDIQSNLQTEDPRLKLAQMQALKQLQNISQDGGMTDQMRFRLALANQNAAQQARGQRGALQQQMQSRGLGGSGLNLASQLGANQAAVQGRSMQGLGAAAEAERRALQALQGVSGLAGSIRGQDMQRKQALDAIRRFNASNRLSTRQANQAQQWAQNQARAQARQTDFRNRLGVQSGKSNIYGDQARYYGNKSDAAKKEGRKIFGSLLGTVGKIATRGENE